jgi:hypothetical protein
VAAAPRSRNCRLFARKVAQTPRQRATRSRTHSSVMLRLPTPSRKPRPSPLHLFTCNEAKPRRCDELLTILLGRNPARVFRCILVKPCGLQACRCTDPNRNEARREQDRQCGAFLNACYWRIAIRAKAAIVTHPVACTGSQCGGSAALQPPRSPDTCLAHSYSAGRFMHCKSMCAKCALQSRSFLLTTTDSQ